MAVTALVFATLLLSAAGEDHPLSKDRTGIHWVFPFKEAQAQAAKEDRLLLIKPVAFGTTPDGGW